MNFFLLNGGAGDITPELQATSIAFSNITTTTFTISWTNGNGSNRLVLVKAGSPVNATPANGQMYTPNTAFGTGAQIGTGNYVVFSGPQNTVNVTGLTANTQYYVQIFEYSGAGAATRYKTTIATGNPSSSFTFTSQFQAVMARANTLGYTVPSVSTQLALNTFIRQRVADGSFALMDLLKIASLNNLALQNFSLLNYVTPTSFQSTLFNLPTYTLLGWMGDGVSSYIDDNYNPSTQATNYLQNSGSRGAYVTQAFSLGSFIDGHPGASNGNTIRNSSSTGQRISQGATNLNTAVDMSGTGYRAINRPNSTNVDVFVGTTKNSRTANSAAQTNDTCVWLRSNASYGSPTIGLRYIGGSLSDTQHNNIANDFSSLLAMIGL